MRRVGYVAVTLLSACGEDAGERATTPDAGPLVFAACNETAHVGTFSVELTEKYTGVQGQVFDGVAPSDVLETLAADGNCRHVRAPIFFCDPACPVGQTCDATGTCVRYPLAQDVGTVTVTGLLAEVEMEALAPANYYTNPDPLPHPGFEPGADIRLQAAGGEFPAFALRGYGVEALEVDASEVPVQSGSPVPLAWTAPDSPGPTRVRVALNVNGHGTTASRIACEVEDAGSFTIPEALVTSLIADGLSGFPTLTLTRLSSDAADTDLGCVELRVQSARKIPVTIPGLVSCDGNEDCTPPETCRSDLTCG